MTSREIILRAEQYANKENAEFYSYAEKIAMLNESWISLYQYLCNTGDKYWCKRTSFTGRTITLPTDCYQISAVYRQSSYGKRAQVFRYTLFNNTLSIDEMEYYNGYSYILEYYPQPITLTFKDEIKKCPFQLANMVDIHDGKVLIKGDTYYSIYDTVTKATIDTVIPISDWAHMYDDGSIVTFNSSTLNYNIYNYGNNTVYSSIVLVVYDNNVYYLGTYNGNNVLYDGLRNVVKTNPTGLSRGFYTTEDFDTFTMVDTTNNTATLGINDTETYILASTGTGITGGNRVYTKYKIVGYYDNAFLTYDTLSSVFYIESLYNDTVLDYPNNIFFTFIALDIAIKMRSKQGIDNTQLDSQWQLARTALFNSIEKNKGNHVTIKDVYNDELSLGGIYY